MARQRNWSREETLAAFRLYCSTPFGRLHQGNAEAARLATGIGRTVSAVVMKACNFARLDPIHQARGIDGLAHGARLEETIWEEFQHDSEAVAMAAEAAYEKYMTAGAAADGGDVNASDATETTDERADALILPEGRTEVERTVAVRRVQGFFRMAVLSSYGGRCAVTGLGVSALLNASHIVPWAVDRARRADPTNGLCLNTLHDRAFDRGLITFDEDRRMVVSSALTEDAELDEAREILVGMAGRELRAPERFGPSAAGLAWHREMVFQG